MQIPGHYSTEERVLKPLDPFRGLLELAEIELYQYEGLAHDHSSITVYKRNMDFSIISWGGHERGETPVMTCGTEYSCDHIRFGSETFLSTACSHRCPVNPAKHLVDG